MAMKWGVGKVGAEGMPISIGGLNVWDNEWVRLDEEPVDLPHPGYDHQLHKMWLYRIGRDGKSVTFAAGELSANVWGFHERLE